jgi:hypothetical protein
MDAGLKACRILEHLMDRLHGATVDYESSNEVHTFVIRYAGSRFKVQFREQWLLRRNGKEIEETIVQIVERICTQSRLHPNRVSTNRLGVYS